MSFTQMVLCISQAIEAIEEGESVEVIEQTVRMIQEVLRDQISDGMFNAAEIKTIFAGLGTIQYMIFLRNH